MFGYKFWSFCPRIYKFGPAGHNNHIVFKLFLIAQQKHDLSLKSCHSLQWYHCLFVLHRTNIPTYNIFGSSVKFSLYVNFADHMFIVYFVFYGASSLHWLILPSFLFFFVHWSVLIEENTVCKCECEIRRKFVLDYKKMVIWVLEMREMGGGRCSLMVCHNILHWTK